MVNFTQLYILKIFKMIFFSVVYNLLILVMLYSINHLMTLDDGVIWYQAHSKGRTIGIIFGKGKFFLIVSYRMYLVFQKPTLK